MLRIRLALVAWTLLGLVGCSMNSAIGPDNNRLPGQGPGDTGPKDDPNTGPPPVIRQVSPSQAHPGELVTIYGRFLYGSQVVVKFKGEETRNVTRSIDGQRLMVHVPWGAKTGDFVIEVDDKTSEDFAFVVLPAIGSEKSNGALVPTLSRVEPQRAKIGDSVVVSGANLRGSRQVLIRFGGVEAAAMRVSPQGDALAAIIPQGAHSGTLDVVVDGCLSNPLPFSVLDRSGMEIKMVKPEHEAPRLEAVSPDHGRPGAPIEITGERLNGREIEVHFAGMSTHDVHVMSQQKSLLVVVPEGASSGMLDLTIDGHRSNRIAFRVDP